MSRPGGGPCDAAGESGDTSDSDILEVRLANEIASIEAGRVELARFCNRHAVSARVINRLEVVFEEIVSNVVRHGFVAGSAQSLRVRAHSLANRIVLTFEDDGAPFDPLARAAPAPLTTLADAPLGSLGIALVRKLVAGISYRRVDGGAECAGFAPVNRLVVAVARE